jgi:hypothetical protein
MVKNVYEILDEFVSIEGRENKKVFLRENAFPYFLQVLKYTFDPQYQFYIKEFPKKYITPDTFPGLRYAGIESEIHKSYLFLKGNDVADILDDTKREELLTQLIESFEPREAEIFVNMMLKDLKTKYLTYNLVKEAFPDLLP